MILDVSTAFVAGESTSAGVGCPQGSDEVGQIVGEDDRGARIVFGGHPAGHPRLDCPWQRVARSGFAERYRFGHWNGTAVRQLTRRSRLDHQPISCLVRVLTEQWEAGGEIVSDSVDRVVGAVRHDRADREVAPARELVADQLTSDLRAYADLVAVHHHGESSS